MTVPHAYGLWSVVAIYSLLFIVFAFSSASRA